MPEPIIPPGASEALVDEARKPTTPWYRAFKRLFQVFNESVTSTASGLGTKAAKTQAWVDHSYIAFPEDKTYRIILKCPFAWKITEVVTRAETGTCTLTVSINGTPLGGSANSVSTTEQAQAHSSSNDVGVGDDVELIVSSNNGAEGISVSLNGTRDLA